MATIAAEIIEEGEVGNQAARASFSALFWVWGS